MLLKSIIIKTVTNIKIFKLLAHLSSLVCLYLYELSSLLSACHREFRKHRVWCLTNVENAEKNAHIIHSNKISINIIGTYSIYVTLIILKHFCIF